MKSEFQKSQAVVDNRLTADNFVMMAVTGAAIIACFGAFFIKYCH